MCVLRRRVAGGAASGGAAGLRRRAALRLTGSAFCLAAGLAASPRRTHTNTPAYTPRASKNAATAARCATNAGGGDEMSSGAKKAPSTGRARSAAAVGGAAPVHSGWSVSGKRDDVVLAKVKRSEKTRAEKGDGAGGAARR